MAVITNLGKTNSEKKLQGNKDRDKLVTRELRKMGWTVIRVWEHGLKHQKKSPQNYFVT